MTEVTCSEIGLATYCTIHGHLSDKNSIALLQSTMAELFDRYELNLIIDFGHVTIINSAALTWLLQSSRLLSERGSLLRVTGLNGTLRDIFYMTGLDRMIENVDAPAAVETQNKSTKLGDFLVNEGVITAKQLHEAINDQGQNPQRLGELLLEKKLVRPGDILKYLSAQLGLPVVNLRSGLYDIEIAQNIDPDIARRSRSLPLFNIDGTVFVATSDPQAIHRVDQIGQALGLPTRMVLSTSEEIEAATLDAYGEANQLTEFLGNLDENAHLEVIDENWEDDYTNIDYGVDGSPVVNLVNGLLQRAIREGVSDIHLEPEQRYFRVRYRVDGVLYQIMAPPSDVFPSVVSRLKVMANLDIAERRLPQDGRIQITNQGKNIDLRFSSLPGIYGEKLVLRLLDRSRAILDVERLGLSQKLQDKYTKLLKRTSGLILVTGPTGSGKTTTLYAGLNYINQVDKSIVTIEDPVEYRLEMINQNQISEKTGLSFARALKHILRQDPDIIMIGEIRERETAEIAVQAALTGHLVLSTLHTNDSAGAVTRMLDMGIEPYLLSSALIGVVAQRLVRQVCNHCATHYMAPADSLSQYGIELDAPVRLLRGRGCEQCFDSGYRGRIAIHELFDLDREGEELILSRPGRSQLQSYFQSRQLETLLDAGIQRAIAGDTTVEEILRVVNSGDL